MNQIIVTHTFTHITNQTQQFINQTTHRPTIYHVLYLTFQMSTATMVVKKKGALM